MRHARPTDLDAIELLLEELREVGGIVERKRGNFSRRSKAFLHFHADPAGIFADVREGDAFVRHRVSTRAEQRAFVRRVRVLLKDGPPGRA